MCKVISLALSASMIFDCVQQKNSIKNPCLKFFHDKYCICSEITSFYRIEQPCGNIYADRGELDRAEEMYRKALDLHQALGNNECLSINYGRLGLVEYMLWNLDKAEEMNRKALEFDQALGHKKGMAQHYSNLGLVYQAHGELDKAEEMNKKAIKLHQTLDSKEGLAQNYGNLGSVYKQRGALDKTEDLWKKSLRLYQEMEHPNAGMIQQWLDELAEARTTSTQ